MPPNLWLTQIRGSELAREGCLSGKAGVLDVPASSQARWSATPVAPTGSVAGPQTLEISSNWWERACSRRLCIWQSRCAGCTGPFASKLAPTGSVAGPQVLCIPSDPWERACSRRQCFLQSRCSECTGPFASKLAPTGSGLPRRFCAYPRTRGTTGVALHLAREGCVSGKADVLNVPAPSQARWSATPVAPTGSVVCSSPFWAYRKSRMSRSSLRPTKIEIDSSTTENTIRMPIESSSGLCPPIRAER